MASISDCSASVSGYGRRRDRVCGSAILARSPARAYLLVGFTRQGAAHSAAGGRGRAVVSRCSKIRYSNTSSARSTSAAGISCPIVFAVRTLMTRSNRVGCSTGRSAGLTPRNNLMSCRRARSRKIWRKRGPYAMRPPSLAISAIGRSQAGVAPRCARLSSGDWRTGAAMTAR